MIRLFIALVARSLRRILSARRIERAFAALPEVKGRETSPETDGICVCALQLEARTYGSLPEWISELDGLFGRAARQGAQLVCLPEFYGMLPLFLSPAVRLALRFAAAAGAGGGEDAEVGPAMDLYPLLAPLTFVGAAYEEIMGRFARRYGIVVFGGTALTAENGAVTNRGFLLTASGEIAGRQDKIFLTAEEQAMGIRPGETLNVVPTELGCIALSVCMDATYFETFRVAKALGADYIIVPIADTADPFSDPLARRGAQARVNEVPLPAVKPALVSAPGFPIRFTGKAGIYFPPGCRAVSVESERPEGTAVILARLRIGDNPSACQNPGRGNPAFDEEVLRRLEECCAAPENEKRKFC